MPDSLLRLDHLALRVSDAEASLSFYGETLGLPLLAAFTGSDWDGMDWLMMIFGLADGRQLALCALDGPDEPTVSRVSDLPHYAFCVEDDAALEAWRERLRCAGIPSKEEDHGTQKSIYMSDPNGIVWEITSPPSRPERSADNPRDAALSWIRSHAPPALS